MKVFIAGGTGLLGSAGASELIKRGHTVSSIALPPLQSGAGISKKMELKLGNFMEMTDGELKEAMSGCGGFVFAAGVDERVEFKPPVYDSYYRYNIEPLLRMLKIAKECGVKKAVVLGSYFSYIAKSNPGLNLYKKHPYIRSRIDQENAALSFSDDDFEVMVLELPYIFGIQEGRKPVWTILVDTLLKMKNSIYFPKGGTAMITVRQAGESIAGALEYGTGGTCYPVGMYNRKWKEFLKVVNRYMGCPGKKIITIPVFLYTLYALKLKKDYQKRGIEPGLDPVAFGRVMSMEAFIDRKIAKTMLKVSEDDIESAIGESISMCMRIRESGEKVISMKAE